MTEDLAIGVDLGGTKIEAIVLRGEQEIARLREPTGRDDGYDAVLARTAAAVEGVCARAGVTLDACTIGVGMPGGVTRREGLVKNSNTVCLNGRPFRADLARALGRMGGAHGARAIAFDNDANCFALAEATLGAARGHDDGVVFGVIMGTGVGGGVVARGRIWPGGQGIAGEWGHHAVWGGAPDARLCYCGKRGCLERYASGPAVEADYLARSGTPATLTEIAARRSSDRHAAAAIDMLLDAFARGLANVIDILDPSVVVLGGGVSNLGCLYDEGVSRVAALVFNDELTTPIVRHAIGDSAGVYGAAFLGRAAAR